LRAKTAKGAKLAKRLIQRIHPILTLAFLAPWAVLAHHDPAKTQASFERASRAAGRACWHEAAVWAIMAGGPSAPRRTAPVSEQIIRYAVVGLGRAGWGIHVHQLRGRGDARIVAVADPVEERRDEAAAEFGCKTYTSLPKLLKQDDVDVVVIATPSADHAGDTKKALKAGRHVVVEKPMATSLAEADAMINAANAAGKTLFVHQNYRFYPEFLHLKEIVDSGLIGRLFHVRNYITAFNRRNDWQTLARNGGGQLNNTAVHFLDQILQFLPGRVTQVMGDLQQIASAGDVEDHVKALLKTDAGATADIEISFAQNVAMPLPKWIVCGTHGTITNDGERSTVRWFDPAEAPPLEVVDGPAANRRYGNDDKLPWREKVIQVQPRPHGAFYDHVAAVLLRGEPLRVTTQSVREVMRVIGLIRKGTNFPGKPVKQPAAPAAAQPSVA
jgi:predicted dehydrogenase